MSMLSSQVDELRELATRYDELQVGAVRAVTMPPNMGSILRDAADTIWELRDDLQRANADNAKLRELAADTWSYINHPVNATWTHKKRKEVRDSIDARMRELGVDA